MPFYRFKIDTHLPQQVVMERIRSLVHERKSFWQSFRAVSQSPATPFIGSVGENSFKVYRDIRYRNSFLPRISGRVHPTGTGTQVDVTMRLHPFTAVFMAVWLGIVGLVIFSTLRSPKATIVLAPAGMFLFGVGLTCGGFFPEAFKAKRLLSEALANPALQSAPPIR